MSDVKLVTLKCPNCGGSLSVGASTETFACEYCGANVAVSRDGNTASLHLLSDGLARIQRGTDKAAAELAIRRLKEELLAARKERSARETARRSELESESWRVQAAKPKRIRELGSALVVFVVAAIPGMFVASVIFNATQTKGREESGLEAALLFLGVVGISTVVALAYLTRRIARRRAELRRVMAQRAESERRYQTELAACERKIGELDALLTKNHQIVDS